MYIKCIKKDLKVSLNEKLTIIFYSFLFSLTGLTCSSEYCCDSSTCIRDHIFRCNFANGMLHLRDIIIADIGLNRR